MPSTLRIVSWHLNFSVVTCSAVSFWPPVPKVELKVWRQTWTIRTQPKLASGSSYGPHLPACNICIRAEAEAEAAVMYSQVFRNVKVSLTYPLREVQNTVTKPPLYILHHTSARINALLHTQS